MLRSCIPAQCRSLDIVLVSHQPPLPMPLPLNRLMTRLAYPCTPFCLALSQTCGSLHTVLTIVEIFKRQKCKWMAQSSGKFSEEMAREFCVSYATTVLNSISKQAKPIAQPLLQATLVQNFFVDIFETTIHRFIYGPDLTLPNNTVEYDYRMGVVHSGEFQRDAEKRESLLREMTYQIFDEGERTELVCNMTLTIRKATLRFTAKFFWTIVCTRLSPTQVDNVISWDRVVMLATLVAGLAIGFARILIALIHERAFKTTTTLPFPCLIFHICRAAGVPIWHSDNLIEATKTVDIGLIKDDTNLAAAWRDPHVYLPPLGVDLVADVKHILVDDTTAPPTTIDA
uniref:Integrase core domain containing protein n=1 Tax=Solanum tuberosum TaxID=4113 RepID=M1DUI5_SOLTU